MALTFVQPVAPKSFYRRIEGGVVRGNQPA
jgi:hypothetical protein